MTHQVDTIVVPLSPGAATDIETRMYAQRMSENMGRTVLVDYKPGAGSTIGTHDVAKSAPDGHTAIVIGPTFTFSNLSYPNLPYDLAQGCAGERRELGAVKGARPE